MIMGLTRAEPMKKEPSERRNRSFDKLPENSRFSQYKIIRRIDYDESEINYLAVDAKYGNKVVLKLLPAGSSAESRSFSLIASELRRILKLRHPNILAFYDIEEHHDRIIIALEYVEGLTLRQLMEASELSMDGIVKILSQICQGLKEAHDNGLIHGCLKPENIIIATDGTVKIMGFGLSEFSREIDFSRTADDPGVLAYCSPEQLAGEYVDYRTDFFSLGIILYEMIVGRNPFGGQTRSEVVNSILKRNPEPLQGKRGDVTADMEKIVSVLLNKNPDFRFQNALDVISGLGSPPAEKPSLHRPVATRKDPWNWIVAAATVVLIAVALYEYLPQIMKGMGQPAGKAKKSLRIMPLEYAGPKEHSEMIEGLNAKIVSELASRGCVRETAAPNCDYILKGVGKYESDSDGKPNLVLTVSLIRPSDDSVIWGNNYIIGLKSAASFPSQIAKDICLHIARL
jgi:serine/threonine protein kinase